MFVDINRHQFIDAFRTMGRMDNFTYDGLNALFDYLEELEEDIGQPMELDVVALCCDFSQDSYQDIKDNYDIDVSECEDEEEERESIIDYLEHETTVIYSDSATVLYQVF